jgi:hypothetical protein
MILMQRAECSFESLCYFINWKTSLTARSAVTSTVVLTDFKINIGNIEFETDSRMTDMICFLFTKILNLWTFLIDLLDPNNTLSQF